MLPPPVPTSARVGSGPGGVPWIIPTGNHRLDGCFRQVLVATVLLQKATSTLLKAFQLSSCTLLSSRNVLTRGCLCFQGHGSLVGFSWLLH